MPHDDIAPRRTSVPRSNGLPTGHYRHYVADLGLGEIPINIHALIRAYLRESNK